MKNHRIEIVADGAQRLREAKNFHAVKQRISSEVRQRYAAAKKDASFWRRLWLEFEIRRVVSAELNKEFPPAALHIAARLT